MQNSEKWKPRILRVAREAKRAAIAAAKHADALLKVARQKAETAARRRRVRKTLRQASQVLKSAGKAALAAGAAAAMAAVVHEIEVRARKRRRDQALAAANAGPLRFEELLDVFALSEPRRMSCLTAMLQIRTVIRRSDDAAHDPLHVSQQISFRWHTRSPRTASP